MFKEVDAIKKFEVFKKAHAFGGEQVRYTSTMIIEIEKRKKPHEEGVRGFFQS